MTLLANQLPPDPMDSRSQQPDTDQERSAGYILMNQYFAAVDLYKHEDGLNWQKVNHLLYVNAALGAIVGFVLERERQDLFALSMPALLLTIAAIGLLVSVGFGVALWFGTHYLNNRKRAVLVVEERLIARGGVPVVTPVSCGVPTRFQRVSPTIWVLRLLPMGFVLLWTSLVCVILWQLVF